MTARWQGDPVYAFDDIIGKLRQEGVKLPERVAHLYATFTAITVPDEPEPDAAANAIASGEAASAVDDLIRAQLFTPALRAASARGKHIAAQRGLQALSKYAAEIHEQLSPTAEYLIEEIEQVARIGNISLRECLRTRDGRACAWRRTEEVGSWLGR